MAVNGPGEREGCQPSACLTLAPRSPAARPAGTRMPRIRDFRRSWLRPEILRHDPGLAARPPVRYMLKVAGSRHPSCRSRPVRTDNRHSAAHGRYCRPPRRLARWPGVRYRKHASRWSAIHIGHQIILKQVSSRHNGLTRDMSMWPSLLPVWRCSILHRLTIVRRSMKHPST